MKEKVKIGVIGTGIGRNHIGAYQGLTGAEVVGVADIERSKVEAVAREYGIPKSFTDYRHLLEEKEIDAVSICTPNYLHSKISITALEAGKHVLCEKPMATSVSEAQKMVETSRRTGKKFMLALNQRFQTNHQFLKKYIENGELGDIYFAKTGWVRRKSKTNSPGKWFSNKSISGGGPLIDLGVHILDLTLWLMGAPKVISVSGSVYTKFGKNQKGAESCSKGSTEKTFDVEDFAFAMLKLNNGATLTLETSWGCFTKEERLFMNLLGSKGGLNLRPLEIYTEHYDSPVDIVLGPDKTTGYEGEVAHFIDCILKDKEPSPNGEEGLYIQEILDAIYKSAEMGKEIETEMAILPK